MRACRECGRPVDVGVFRVDGDYTHEPPATGDYRVVFESPYCSECSAAGAAQIEDERRQAEVERLLGWSEVGGRWAGWGLDTYPQDDEGAAALEVARGWLARYRDGNRGNLILHGTVGAGKSGLAWGMVRDLIERDVTPALFVNWRDLLGELRAAIGNDEVGEPAKVARARSARVLALDDLGAERPTEYALQELALLVDHRYRELLPTIVTTNHGPAALIERLGRDEEVAGKRLVSRLLEGATVVELAAADRRRVKAA